MCEKSPIPTPVLVVVVENHGAVVGWPLVVPGNPTLLALPLHKTRKTLALIREKKAFSINFVKDAERAFEIFGKPGEDKLSKWGASSKCKTLPCNTLGDASRVVECLYESEIEVGEHVLVLCQVKAAYGCGDYAVWDPCSLNRQRQAE